MIARSSASNPSAAPAPGTPWPSGLAVPPTSVLSVAGIDGARVTGVADNAVVGCGGGVVAEPVELDAQAE